MTIIASEDAYVNELALTRNYGSSRSIRVDGSPVLRSYMRFDLSHIDGPIRKATLRIYANSSSNHGYNVHRVTDHNWNESTINYGNSPSLGSIFATSETFAGQSWTEVDVSLLVTSGGIRDFALTTSHNRAINLASRESGTNAPQLIIETTGGGATPTPTPTVAPSVTSTPIITNTPTP